MFLDIAQKYDSGMYYNRKDSTVNIKDDEIGGNFNKT